VESEVEGYHITKNGTFVFKGRVCVPDDKDLKEEILRQAHQSRFAIHPGSTKMYRDLKRYYHWVKMKREVADWVAKCTTCQLVKAEHKSPSGLLQGLPLPEWKWDMVTMDFVTGLPRTASKQDAIWVIVDRLTKSAHFLAVNKKDTADRLAQKYMDEIVRRHGVPVSIVSDRDSKFTSLFWKAFQKALGTKVHLSKAYHPQTDGQFERTIQTLEDMLRACMLDWGGRWEKYLPLVEFAYNNSYHSSIGMPPFEALYGRPCRTPLCWTEVGERQDIKPEIIQESTEQVELLKNRLREAHDRQKSYADKRRKGLEFKVGDLVYLKMRLFKGLNRWAKRGKLKSRYMGPYPIIERVGAVAYRLDLPADLAAFHDVFHISVLRKVVTEPKLIISRPPEDLELDLSVKGKPVSIVSHRENGSRGKKVKSIQVCWERDGIQELSWESERMMREDYPELFKDEEEDHGDGSNSRTNSIVVGENCNTPILQLDHEAQVQPANDLNPSENLMIPRDYKRRTQTPNQVIKTLSRQPRTTQTTGDRCCVEPESPRESS